MHFDSLEDVAFSLKMSIYVHCSIAIVMTHSYILVLNEEAKPLVQGQGPNSILPAYCVVKGR